MKRESRIEKRETRFSFLDSTILKRGRGNLRSLRILAGPEGAGHVDLLADLLERLLEERQRQLGDGLLLLSDLALLRHDER